MLLPLKEAAVVLGMTENALRCRIKRGQFDVVRVGRSVYLRRKDVLGVVACGLSPSEVSGGAS